MQSSSDIRQSFIDREQMLTSKPYWSLKEKCKMRKIKILSWLNGQVSNHHLIGFAYVILQENLISSVVPNHLLKDLHFLGKASLKTIQQPLVNKIVSEALIALDTKVGLVIFQKVFLGTTTISLAKKVYLVN